MKHWIMLGCAAAALLLSPMAASAADLTGEPVDITCYMKGQSGPGHAGCAKSCVSKGKPIGLVVGEGDAATLYLVTGEAKLAKEYLADHMGQQVKVSGKISKKDGMNIVTVSAVKAAEGSDSKDDGSEHKEGSDSK